MDGKYDWMHEGETLAEKHEYRIRKIVAMNEQCQRIVALEAENANLRAQVSAYKILSGALLGAVEFHKNRAKSTSVGIRRLAKSLGWDEPLTGGQGACEFIENYIASIRAQLAAARDEGAFLFDAAYAVIAALDRLNQHEAIRVRLLDAARKAVKNA